MAETLKTGNQSARINLALDYADGTQVTLGWLGSAQKLEIEYEWKKDYATTTAATQGTWTATNFGELDDGRPCLYYLFSGADIVPSDGEGWLEVRAKITDVEGRVVYSDTDRIQVVPDETRNG